MFGAREPGRKARGVRNRGRASITGTREGTARSTGAGSRTQDGVVKKAPEAEFISLVKQTYRILLTRGMKRCYVYFVNKNTKEFFRSRMESLSRPAGASR
ncbi:MAG: DUF2075 domain-containing protein [Acidobacteriota bacterium]|nr:DUF2075 domain-containing protein [Acidobacteriota bacterium]